MRRVVLLCLVALTLRFAAAQAPVQPRYVRPVAPPYGFHNNQRQQQQSPSARYCDATPRPSVALDLDELTLQRADGKIEFAKRLLTWAPGDNDKECAIRQMYFNFQDKLDHGLPSPDIHLQLYHHGSNEQVQGQLSYDFIQLNMYGGKVSYRVDVQSPTPLQGDFDLYVSVVGKPAATPAKKH